MSINLSGRLALITGATRGIGAAVAKGVSQAGAHVILIARTQGALEEIDDEIRAAGAAPATLLAMNLQKLDDIDKLGPTILERFGKLDIFIGNAGMLGPLAPAHQIKPKDWQKIMFTNFMSNVRLVQTLDPLLRASDSGRVVFTTSQLAQEPLAYWSPYCASKAALEAFMRSYAAETQKTAMRVNAVDPGIVDTNMLSEAYPGGFDGNAHMPEDVVPLFLELLRPDCSMHGKILRAEMLQQNAAKSA